MDPAGTLVRVGDRRQAADVGRHARLELVFGCRDGRTWLRHSYAEPPFRAGRTFQDGDGVRAILATTAPGIFNGDCLTQHVIVERGARVRLTSQSALQAHPSPHQAPARLTSTYTVEEDATLVCEWDPLIPFRDARFEQRTHVRLAENARLFWSEAMMAGREAHDERWAFNEVRHELKISRNGLLEYVERYRLRPADGGAVRTLVAGRACFFGTVVSSGHRTDAVSAAALHDSLSDTTGVRSAVDRLADRLELVRLAADSGASFRAVREMVARARFL